MFARLQLTVSVTVVLWLREPAVAVMVMVLLPDGVPGFDDPPPPPLLPPPPPPPPPHEVRAPKVTARAAKASQRIARLRRPRHRKMGNRPARRGV